MGHDIHKEFWKKTILGKFVFYIADFDPIEIQTCLAPHNDRQDLLFVKDTYVNAKKMTTKGSKWPLLKLKFSDFFFFQN